MRRLIPDPGACRGCQTCELVCALAHEGSAIPRAARIHVFQDLGVCAPRVCIQCEEAKCIEACSQNAIQRDAERASVRVNEEECTGCGACVSACPFGGVSLHPTSGRALICDLCGECVDACPFGALAFRETTAQEMEVVK